MDMCIRYVIFLNDIMLNFETNGSPRTSLLTAHTNSVIHYSVHTDLYIAVCLLYIIVLPWGLVHVHTVVHVCRSVLTAWSIQVYNLLA